MQRRAFPCSDFSPPRATLSAASAKLGFSRPPSRSSPCFRCVPTLGVLLMRDEARLVATLRRADSGVDGLPPLLRLDRPAHGEPSGPLQPLDLVGRRGASPSSIPASSRAIASPTRFPTGSRRWRQAASLDAEISGSNPIQVLITFPPGLGLYAPQTLATIARRPTGRGEPARGRQRVVAGDVAALAGQAEWALTGSRRASPNMSTSSRCFLVRRFVAKDESSVDRLRPRARQEPDAARADRRPSSSARLNAVRKADPGYGIAVTGLSVIAARNSADMINKLEPGADDRIRLHRRLHRPRVPLGPHRPRVSAVRNLPSRRRRARS